MAPIHYLHHCWLLTNEVLWYSRDNISTVRAETNVRLNKATQYTLILLTSPSGQWVNICTTLQPSSCRTLNDTALRWATLYQLSSRFVMIDHLGIPQLISFPLRQTGDIMLRTFQYKEIILIDVMDTYEKCHIRTYICVCVFDEIKKKYLKESISLVVAINLQPVYHQKI